MGKHKLLKLFTLSAGTMFGINKYIEFVSNNKNKINDSLGEYYHWNHGNIYYKKRGSGSPILLIHNLDHISSMFEWSKIERKLEKKYTVYTLDLLGCGLSDKPNITYTNYLYVQLVSDFVKNIIKEKTDIIVSNDSSSFVIMANHIHPELFHQILLINPNDLNQTSMEPSLFKIIKKNILYLPLIGTSLYNYYVNEESIKNYLNDKYFSQMDDSSILDLYYQSAHLHKSNGRYLYACKNSNYLNVNMKQAIKNKDNISIISSSSYKDNDRIINQYKVLNNSIEIHELSHCKLLPHLEEPAKFFQIILD